MKILIVQTAFLGDVILATSVIQGVRELYPTAEIYFLTTPQGAALLEKDPALASVIAFDKRSQYSGIKGLFEFSSELKKYDFDLVFNLHKSWRTALLLYLTRIKRRIAFKSARLSFLYTELIKRDNSKHEAERALSILSREEGYSRLNAELRLFTGSKISIKQRYAVIAPGSIWPTKRWPAEYYREIGQYLLLENFSVVLVGSEAEQEICNIAYSEGVQNLCGKTTLSELMGLVKNASLLICNDSMILHVASAFKTPVVCIFCATSPKFGFGPYKNQAIVVEKKELTCKPCSRHGGKNCPLKTNACMKELYPEQVINAIKHLV